MPDDQGQEENESGNQAFADAEADSASNMAMIALGQLCYQLFECRLVLEALPCEVALNLDEAVQSISVAQRSAREAYRAASLLRRGAALEKPWGTGPSRPKAVFARHRAAVEAGARRITPELSRTDRFSDGLDTHRSLDRVQDIAGPRPTCKATLADGSRRCVKSALYLGAGRWAPNCYAHASAADRNRFRKHNQRVEVTRDNDYAAQRDLLVQFGLAVMFGWADAHDASESASTAAAGEISGRANSRIRRR